MENRKLKSPTKPIKIWKEKTKKSNFTKEESNLSFRDFEIEFSLLSIYIYLLFNM